MRAFAKPEIYELLEPNHCEPVHTRRLQGIAYSPESWLQDKIRDQLKEWPKCGGSYPIVG
jgi:hypothetical protein